MSGDYFELQRNKRIADEHKRQAQRISNLLANGEAVDDDGFDSDGFNKDGFNRQGLSRLGKNRFSYLDGVDLDGFDPNGNFVGKR